MCILLAAADMAEVRCAFSNTLNTALYSSKLSMPSLLTSSDLRVHATIKP
jgi:hypothetical protein